MGAIGAVVEPVVAGLIRLDKEAECDFDLGMFDGGGGGAGILLNLSMPPLV